MSQTPIVKYQPGRDNRVSILGREFSGQCLWNYNSGFPVNRHLFVGADNQLYGDPQILPTAPPEVQYFGQVIENNYIIVTPKRLPVLI